METLAWLSDKATVDELKSILFGLNYRDEKYALGLEDDAIVIIRIK
jgi:hypothetical protein